MGLERFLTGCFSRILMKVVSTLDGALGEIEVQNFVWNCEFPKGKKDKWLGKVNVPERLIVPSGLCARTNEVREMIGFVMGEN